MRCRLAARANVFKPCRASPVRSIGLKPPADFCPVSFDARVVVVGGWTRPVATKVDDLFRLSGARSCGRFHSVKFPATNCPSFVVTARTRRTQMGCVLRRPRRRNRVSRSAHGSHEAVRPHQLARYRDSCPRLAGRICTDVSEPCHSLHRSRRMSLLCCLASGRNRESYRCRGRDHDRRRCISSSAQIFKPRPKSRNLDPRRVLSATRLRIRTA